VASPLVQDFFFTTCAGIPMSLNSPMQECLIPQMFETVSESFSPAIYFSIFYYYYHYYYRFELLQECESHPDKWFRGEALSKYQRNLELVARFVGSDPKNVVFVPNPTTGINAVLSSLQLEAGDGILCNSHTYNAIKNTIEFTTTKWDAKIVSVDISLPIQSSKQLVEVSTNTQFICS
jgi:hypothetical protein